MMGYYNNYMFGFGWIFMIIFWGLVIWGIFALIRGAGIGGCCGHNHSVHGDGKEEGAALRILKERYAKGEITKEQFEEMKKNIID